MVFRYYSNAVSQASRSMAGGIGVVGLLLIGFGVLIIALPELFALLAAVVFFLAGFGCAMTAAKIYWAQYQIDRMNDDGSGAYRRNVRIHTDDPFDV